MPSLSSDEMDTTTTTTTTISETTEQTTLKQIVQEKALNNTEPLQNGSAQESEVATPYVVTSKDDTTTTPLNEEVKKSNVTEDIFITLNSRVQRLVHWENTVHSGTALTAILAFLIFTAYNSLFNTFCVLATIAILVNWTYVTVHKQYKTFFSQDTAHPLEKYLVNPPQISRVAVDKYVDIWVEIINRGLQEGTHIVLIEEPLRSLKYVGIFYLLWTIVSWFSFRTIIATGVILAFAVPKAYKKNQALVDEHLGKAHAIVRVYVDQGMSVLQKHTGDIVAKGKKSLASKGLVKDDDTEKKQE